MKDRWALFFATILGMTSVTIAGETFRCGTHLIEENDHITSVLEHCGEPTYKSGNQWIYDRGEHDFVTIVTIRGNDQTIARIQQEQRD